MANTIFVPNFLKTWDWKPYEGILYARGMKPPKEPVIWMPPRPVTADKFVYKLTLGVQETGACHASATLEDVPSKNCGMMQMTQPSVGYLREDHAKQWLLFLEAFSRSKTRSVLIGNDGIWEQGRTWQTIKTHGADYHFIEAGWNRNYSPDNHPHRVGIYYKNIGEVYYPNIYGLGAEFTDASHYPRS